MRDKEVGTDAGERCPVPVSMELPLFQAVPSLAYDTGSESPMSRGTRATSPRLDGRMGADPPLMQI